MKKKLLTLLLSIAVILTSTVTVFAEGLGDNPTIAQVLATVEGGFPTSTTDAIPNDAWVDSNGYRTYIKYNKLVSNNPMFQGDYAIDTVLTKDGDDYKTPMSLAYLTFKTESGVLKEIVLNYMSAIYTFTKPITVNEVNITYTDFDFSNFTFKLPESLDVTKYTVNTNTYQVGLIKGEEIVYYYDNTKGYWIKDGGDGSQCTPNKNDVDKAFIIFDISATDGNIFAENTVKVIANSKELNPVNINPYVEGFELDNINTIECNLLFDIPAVTPGTLDITKNGAPATQGTDYKWVKGANNALDLKILKSGLTVSGEDIENDIKIETASDVSNLTIKDLIIESSNSDCIRSLGSLTINVEGDNSLKNTNEHGAVINAFNDTVIDTNLKLTGSGNLEAIATSNVSTIVVAASGKITLDVSGNMIFDGAKFGISCDDFEVTNGIGKVLIYGDDPEKEVGAINWYCNNIDVIGDKVTLFGSSELGISEDNITEKATVGLYRDGSYGRFVLKSSAGTDNPIPTKSVLMMGPIKEVEFTYGDFNFEEFTFVAPTVSDDAPYIPFIESELFLLLGSEGVACSPNYGGIWYEYGTTTPIDNIKEVDFDTIAFNTWFESKYKFDSNITVKGNGVALNPVDNITQLQDGKTEGFFLFEVANNVIASVKTANKYVISDGNKAKINKDAIKDTLFKSNADFSKFIEVRVDGKIITEGEDYTVESGSTRATLSKSFLSDLALGEHTLAIISKDGQASTTFTITRNAKPNPGYVVPKTGIN